MTFESHCINSSLTIKDALIALNNLRNATLTLFVLTTTHKSLERLPMVISVALWSTVMVLTVRSTR